MSETTLTIRIRYREPEKKAVQSTLYVAVLPNLTTEELADRSSRRTYDAVRALLEDVGFGGPVETGPLDTISHSLGNVVTPVQTSDG